MINTPPNKHCLIIPGRGYSHTSEHANIYKEKIKKIANDKITKPYYGNVEIQTAGATRNFIFKNIPNPRQFCLKVSRICEKLIAKNGRFDVIRRAEGLTGVDLKDIKKKKSLKKKNQFQKPKVPKI